MDLYYTVPVLYSYIGFPCIRGPAPTRDSASDDYVVLFEKRAYLLIFRCFSLLLVCCFLSWQGMANDASLQASRKREPSLLNFNAADEEIIEIAVPEPDRDGGNPHIWSTLPVPIVDDQ